MIRSIYSIGSCFATGYDDVMPRYPTTSMTLLERIRENDSLAWERLVDFYAPLVRHWCRRSGLSPEDTADIFQETFRSVAEKFDGFRHDRDGDTFRGWLRTITVNKIRDHARRMTDRPIGHGGSDARRFIEAQPDPLAEDDPAEESLLQDSVRRALDWIRGDFEPQTWTAFWQAQIEEQPTGEIAERLGMTAAAVRKAKYRVLQRLREELEGLADLDG